ncbi:hypothetical protein M413DRAFT_189908 [Hebeloma cylindrosporum]|uniref:Uncharacterized protein n=1 Tax=Hebeloma cylindrosporum TaxID=76867 RepID=A0A0C3C8T1_HEBCY|nr:hypothetical protein M413DRAFT_189908 [Hebeloma cylindrosporum h7]
MIVPSPRDHIWPLVTFYRHPKATSLSLVAIASLLFIFFSVEFNVNDLVFSITNPLLIFFLLPACFYIRSEISD